MARRAGFVKAIASAPFNSPPAIPTFRPQRERGPMLRFIVRLLGIGLLVAGFAVGVIDGAKSLDQSSVVLTPLGAALFWLFPRQFPVIEPAITRHVHPALWDPVLLNLFLLPAVIVCFALGALFLVIARRRA
jgi:hypothetical protein